MKKAAKKKKEIARARASSNGVHDEKPRLLPTRLLIEKIAKDHHTKGVFSPR